MTPTRFPAMNKLYYGNNLDVLRDAIATESVDLIYLDPPFNSKRDYNLLFKSPNAPAGGGEALYSAAQIEAFEDTWQWTQDVTEREYDEVIMGPNSDVSEMMKALVKFLGRNDMTAYLVMMANRLVELQRVLKPTVGPCLWWCIFVFCLMSFTACSDAAKHLLIKDENGTPVSTASVNCSWTTYPIGFMSAFRPGHHHEYDGTSDINGRFDFVASKEMVFFKVTKPGYYPSNSSFDLANRRRVNLRSCFVAFIGLRRWSARRFACASRSVQSGCNMIF